MKSKAMHFMPVRSVPASSNVYHGDPQPQRERVLICSPLTLN